MTFQETKLFTKQSSFCFKIYYYYNYCLLEGLCDWWRWQNCKILAVWTDSWRKSESKAKVLSLLHSRTLKLEDTVLCVRLSANGKFIAVALLDSTVKIFFVDTFKVSIKYQISFRGKYFEFNFFKCFMNMYVIIVNTSYSYIKQPFKQHYFLFIKMFLYMIFWSTHRTYFFLFLHQIERSLG